ncbi:AAA family ATPase [Lacticaseibacillus jixianensis]|uniref:AAA family ATPase n=1 Tax=Lacticaseibacillus jixianensis TaxID=2486012 RepID=A0ABW4BCB8_9LACO|nr:AAA family ATPase [Lacticaseibacillus jixianensis]
MSKQFTLPKRYTVQSLSESKSISTLTAKILKLQAELDLKSFTIVSASQGDGKTAVVSSLAMNYASTGRKVLIINANPFEVANFFDVPSQKSLTDLLSGSIPTRSSIEEATSKVPETLIDVINGPQDPSALVNVDAKERMHELLTVVESTYDLILFDGPAFDEGASALALTGLVGNVLVVLRRDFSKVQAVDAMMTDLKGIDVNALGSVVLNNK